MLLHSSRRDHPSKKGRVDAMVALFVLEVAMVASIPSIWKDGRMTGITLLHFSRRDPLSKKRRERAILISLSMQ